MLAIDNLVVYLGQATAVLGAEFAQVFCGSSHVEALAQHVEDIALGVGQQTLPVIVVMALGVEVARLGGHGEVEAYLRRLLVVVGVVAEVAVTAVGGGDDVDTVVQGVVGGHLAFGLDVLLVTQVVDAEAGGVGFLDALGKDDDLVALGKVDAGGVFVVVVG